MSVADTTELTRVILDSEGVVKANFADNSIILLSATGSTFVYCAPDGQQTRQLCEYALTKYSTKLAVALEFRNMHTEHPFFCKTLLQTKRDGMTLGYHILDVWWPTTASQALESSLVEFFPDGRISVSTEDNSARIVLHFHCRRFAVCYPLLVQEQLSRGAFDYVWHTQVFSVAHYPERWNAAVQLVLQVEQAVRQQHSLPPDDVPAHEPCDDQATSSHSHAWDVSPHLKAAVPKAQAQRTQLPTAHDRGLSNASEQFPADAWWYEQTTTLLPSDTVVLLEWTPQATYQYLPHSDEVEVWVHSDESCLSTVKRGRFISHVRGVSKSEAAVEQLYAYTCVPEYAWHHGSGERYPLAALAAHAVKMRSQMSSIACKGVRSDPAAQATQPDTAYARDTSSVEQSFAVQSQVMTEECHVPGVGHFMAFEDGRVRASFQDRAIVHMNCQHSYCKVILPDGKLVLVATSSPVGVESYVAEVMEFARWAFQPAASRLQEAALRARIQAEIASNQRMRCILDWKASGGAAEQQYPAAVEAPRALAEGRPALALGAGLDAALGDPQSRQQMIESMLRRNAELLQRF